MSKRLPDALFAKTMPMGNLNQNSLTLSSLDITSGYCVIGKYLGKSPVEGQLMDTFCSTFF